MDNGGVSRGRSVACDTWICLTKSAGKVTESFILLQSPDFEL